MIKEFWQERREEKKRQKQLRKENKKLPKTKEQIAYKVFGFLFTIFLIFGSIGYACNKTGSFDNINWNNVIGVTEEMLEALDKPVDKNLIINECVISYADWGSAQEELQSVGVEIAVENKLNVEVLLNEGFNLSSEITFKMMSLGALTNQMIEELGKGDSIELHSFKLYLEENDLMLKSVCSIDLSAIVVNSSLPIVYVTTVSRLNVLNKKLYSLDSEIQINQLDKKLNDEIVDFINSKSFLSINDYSNDHIVEEINLFATLVNAEIEISGQNITFKPKN